MVSADSNRRQAVTGCVAWIALTFLAAGIGGAGSVDAPAFYASLDRPVWAPPAWLFGPVWTLLYTMMGIAACRVRLGASPERRIALSLYAAQLAVNALWSWTFFKWQSGLGALVTILVLDALVIATMLRFRSSGALAVGLMGPYLGWILFATALTIACWLRNRALLG